MVYRILYVSRSLLPESDAADIVHAIVETSIARNSRDGLTGALVFTGRHFAQALEGDMPSVLALMADIARDRGHTDIEIAEQGTAPSRVFAEWSMGYWGTSAFVDRLIEGLRPSSLIAGSKRQDGGLLRFMTQWSQRQSA